jgi:alpha-tubulin suppressor-like RCC1 family protein
MVGVIVISVIAGTIAATVFAVIPWSQDAATKQALDAVRTAESVAYVQDSKFSDFAGLRASDRIQASTAVSVGTDSGGTCFVAIARSTTGTRFYMTNLSPDILPFSSTTTTSCLSDTEMAQLAISNGATPAETPMTMVSAGSYHSAAIDREQHLWLWGSDGSGQLGDDSALVSQNSPVAVAPTRKFISVSAGGNHTVAIDDTNHLWAWGSNTSGQIGDGTTISRPTPTAIAPNQTFKMVSAGDISTAAIDTSNRLWTWGSDSNGQLGDDAAYADKLIPTAIVTGLTYQSVSAGARHMAAVDTSNRVWSWGSNQSGQLGDSTTLTRPTPVSVPGTFATVVAGGNHTLALDMNNHIWSWGQDTYGQLGDSTAITNMTSPVPVAPGTTFVRVSAGWDNSAAIDSTKRLWTWGEDRFGSLGDGGAQVNQPLAVAVASNQLFVSLDAGAYHSVAVDTSNHLWAWGYGANGQLGTVPFLTNQAAPASVSGW